MPTEEVINWPPMEEVIEDHPMEYDDNKFLVVPTADARKLPDELQKGLFAALAHIMEYRVRAGKPASNKYFVVNQDEPYAGQILHDILIAEEKKAWAIQQGLWPKPRRRKTDSD